MERTMEERLLSGVAHLSLFLAWVGPILNLGLFLIYRSRKPFISGHAKQALGIWAFTYVLGTVAVFFAGAAAMGSIGLGRSSGLLGGSIVIGVLLFCLALATLVLIVTAAYHGVTGREYQYPVIGSFVARLGE